MRDFKYSDTQSENMYVGKNVCTGNNKGNNNNCWNDSASSLRKHVDGPISRPGRRPPRGGCRPS
jgi:hypothetical protein